MSTPSPLDLTSLALAARIKARAREVGFDLAGIASAEPSRYREHFRRWLDEGQAGSMGYMANRFDERTQPATYLPGAASVVCVALNYHVPLEPVAQRNPSTPQGPSSAKPPQDDAQQISDDRLHSFSSAQGQSGDCLPERGNESHSPQPSPGVPGEGIKSHEARALPDQPVYGRIARYALGDDYHEVIKKRLHALADFIREIAPQAATRCSVDTAPILERELAARAGIGWIGKNTCLIEPRIGSWIFLGEVITTLPLPADDSMADHCGTCTRCIDACPTHAITAPYQLDARRCISYLTIEHRGEISPELQAGIGDWLYGCDVCQDVCPHNRNPPSAVDPALRPRFPTGSLDVREVSNWDDATYRAKLRQSAMKRIKLPLLHRNARIVMENLDKSR